MIVNTFTQACYVWACHAEDNLGTKLNEHSHPMLEFSKETETVWILMNHFGVLAIVDKNSAKVVG